MAVTSVDVNTLEYILNSSTAPKNGLSFAQLDFPIKLEFSRASLFLLPDKGMALLTPLAQKVALLADTVTQKCLQVEAVAPLVHVYTLVLRRVAPLKNSV